MKNTNSESLKQRLLLLYRSIGRGSEALNDQQWIAALLTHTKRSPLLVYRPTPPLQHLLTQDIKLSVRFNCACLGLLNVATSGSANLSWKLVLLLLAGAGITTLYINSKKKQITNSTNNQFKSMLLAAQDILKRSNDNEEIKNVGNQVERIKQNLESAFQSETALIPKESFIDFLKGYELYTKAYSTPNLKERAESLQALQTLLEDFRNRYKDFISDEINEYLTQLEAWTNISLNTLMAKGLILNASLEVDEIKQLYNFYFGILRYLEIVENYLDFFTEKGQNLARSVAEEVIRHKPFEVLAKKKIQEIDEKSNIAISLRNAAKAMLWELETYKKNQLKDFSAAETLINFAKKSPGWIDDSPKEKSNLNSQLNAIKIQSSRFQPPSGRPLERHAGSWVGDDIEECLQEVHDTRSTF